MSDTPETDSYVNRDWWTLFRANEHSRKLERERDEALSQIVQAECRAERFCQERDEARNAIAGWENKWKCAIDMAAIAEIERDEAINKLKELKDILR